MKRTVIRVTAAIMMLAFSAIAFGQGVKSSTEQRLSDPANGYSFSAPSTWKNTKGDEGFALVDPGQTVIVTVRPHSYKSFEAVVRDTKFDAGFEVVGQPQDLKAGGKTMRVSKQTSEWFGVIDFFVSFSPSDGGVIVMAISEGKNSEAAFKSALKISDSVVFGNPSQPAAASGWQSALAGKHLLYMYSGNGYFEEKHIYLCQAGNFLQTTGSGGYTPGNADGGSFGAKGGKRGTWSVNGSALILQFQDGSVGRNNITKRSASNEIGLNGNRYFVQANAGC